MLQPALPLSIPIKRKFFCGFCNKYLKNNSKSAHLVSLFHTEREMLLSRKLLTRRLADSLVRHNLKRLAIDFSEEILTQCIESFFQGLVPINLIVNGDEISFYHQDVLSREWVKVMKEQCSLDYLNSMIG